MKNVIGKSSALMMATMALATMGGEPVQHRPDFIKREETPEEKALRLSQAKININRKRGLKMFYFGDEVVWAINKKNANKKALRLNLI